MGSPPAQPGVEGFAAAERGGGALAQPPRVGPKSLLSAALSQGGLLNRNVVKFKRNV